MSQTKAVEEWLQIRRRLIELETEFTDKAIKALDGGITSKELESHRQALIEARALCSAAYSRAFPKKSQ